MRRLYYGQMGKKVIFPSPTLEDRYWSKVEQRGDDECWPWTGTTRRGYGTIWVGYDADGKPIMREAHRIGWTYANPEPPGDSEVRHTCDNPPCQNPAHWELGTHLDNMQDMQVRDRAGRVRGSKHGKSKLTEQAVRQIRALYAVGHTQTSIAKVFGVTSANISEIVRGRTWQHI